MVIAAAIGYAIAPIVANIKLADVPSAGVIGLSMVIVATIYAPFSVPNIGSEFASASFNAIGSLVVLGLVCSAAAFVIFFKLIKEVGPAKASLITYLNTAVALTLGTLFLNEPVTTGLLVGLPLIAIGLYLSGGARSKQEIPDTAA
jgi:drug/metabolite transporter (DMT)-like permease